MCNGIKSESKDKERELGFRAREQMEADFCCLQVGLCRSQNSQIYFVCHKQMAF